MPVAEYLDIIRAHKGNISMKDLLKASNTPWDRRTELAAMLRPYTKLVPIGEPNEKGERPTKLVIQYRLTAVPELGFYTSEDTD